MRYLTTSAAASALRRGKEIEQLLGAFEGCGRRGLRYACVWPAARFHGFVVHLHIVTDLEEPPSTSVEPRCHDLRYMSEELTQSFRRDPGLATDRGERARAELVVKRDDHCPRRRVVS